MRTMRIAIVGAGAGGLAALRHSLDDGQQCVVFEQTGTVGGSWNYTDDVGLDENGLPIHTTMYKDLRTNLPKQLMEYENIEYDKSNTKSYISQQEVLDYIHRFANDFRLLQYIKFNTHVIEIDPIEGNKWRIKYKFLKTGEIKEEIFDATIICNGRNSEAFIIPIEGIENFLGDHSHSRNFRTADPYQNKSVLIIGGGPSGIDISRIVSKVAKKVFLSHRSPITGKSLDPKVIPKPPVRRLSSTSAAFSDDSTEQIDSIIFCTGYKYTFPFLTAKCGITIGNKSVHPLYKHLINIEHPTMAFIALLFPICPFLVFGIQVRFFLELLNRRVQITKEEMLRSGHEEATRRGELKVSDAHRLIGKQSEYLDDLCEIGNIKKHPPVLQKLYDRVKANRNHEDIFEIVNDEEFVEIIH